MDSDTQKKALEVHRVTSTDSPEFTLLIEALTRTSLVGLDAEWKPGRTHEFPTVSLLQIACGDSAVFVLDLFSLPLSLVWEAVRELLVSPYILKLGFGFKQDLVYLSSTFSSQGGFDKVEPYLDIRSVYHHLLQHNKKHVPKQIKSLSAICAEVLGFSLSKELQCSDWSRRPLTEEQITYAAMDAYCLLNIFKVFWEKVAKEEVQSWSCGYCIMVRSKMEAQLEKGDIPVFDGREDAYWWVICMEKYFDMMETPDKQRLAYTAKAVVGLPFSWYCWWTSGNLGATWLKFQIAFLWRFKPEYREVLPLSELFMSEDGNDLLFLAANEKGGEGFIDTVAEPTACMEQKPESLEPRDRSEDDESWVQESRKEDGSLERKED